jgi:hypothetical protein
MLCIEKSTGRGLGDVHTPDYSDPDKYELFSDLAEYYTRLTEYEVIHGPTVEERKATLKARYDAETENQIVNMGHEFPPLSGNVFSTSKISQFNFATLNQDVKNGDASFPLTVNIEDYKQYTFTDPTEWNSFYSGALGSIYNLRVNIRGVKIVELGTLTTHEEFNAWESVNL